MQELAATVNKGMNWLSQEIRRRIPAPMKSLLKSAQRRWITTFSSFGPGELKALLLQLGIARGDAVMVHSSFDSFEGFQGSIADLIQVLQDVVGADGALLMPTLPFSGNAIDYVRTNTVMDVKRTPSRMGILTEVFRRLPGVMRSLHPTHPVAGWGSKSAPLLETHRSAQTPCGLGSPFAGLVQADGKVLLLGVGINAMTFYHYLEEDLEAQMPFSPFTSETFTASVRDEQGQVLPVAMRLYDPEVGRLRDGELLTPHLKARRVWREQRVGRLNVIMLRCREVRQVVAEMASRGLFCYHDIASLIDRRTSVRRLIPT
jgi:aminoglycoside 3-N-acetyltransferase